MARKIVPLITGEKYHIYNRGADKRIIFSDPSDYVRFYQTLAIFNTVEPATNYRLANSRSLDHLPVLVSIHAYALLPNHYHLILEQITDGGISEFIKRISGGYTSYFNEKNDRSGALFQGKFKRVHIESDAQYNYLFNYVNENHTVHDLPRSTEMYHSSSLHYQGKMKSKLLENVVPIKQYDHAEATLQAQDIYKRRQQFKDALE
jgi:putative transposase